jgi:hypothetical protein
MTRALKPSAYRYRRGSATTYVTFNFVEEWVEERTNAQFMADHWGLVFQDIDTLPPDGAELAAAARRNGHQYVATSTGASDELLDVWAHDVDAVEEYRIEPLPTEWGARRRR